MKAIWQDTVIAESDDTIEVEGNHYFPRASLDETLIRPSTRTSQCFWKGQAHYLDLVVNGQTNPAAVWYYPDPKQAAAEIRDRVAFWQGVVITA